MRKSNIPKLGHGVGSEGMLPYNTVLGIRIRLDPFHFGQPDPDPVCKKISQNHGKFQQKSTKIIRIPYILFKTIKLMFTDINIFPINNKLDDISEKYISYRKKSKTIFGSGSISK